MTTIYKTIYGEQIKFLLIEMPFTDLKLYPVIYENKCILLLSTERVEILLENSIIIGDMYVNDFVKQIEFFIQNYKNAIININELYEYIDRVIRKF